MHTQTLTHTDTAAGIDRRPALAGATMAQARGAGTDRAAGDGEDGSAAGAPRANDGTGMASGAGALL